MESIVGQTVSHYVFLEKLGAGGMGEIYKARDSRLNRMVAVKVLAPGRTRNPERRRRFIQEAQAASALNHPNIITIHDILPEGDTQYMVMEHVAGKTLHAMIAGGRLPVPQVLQIATQMANALAAAHAAGIIHRDLKPANVMVTSSGLVKVLDFGLAKLMDPTGRMQSGDGETQDPVTLTAAPLTVEGSIMGTVNYMSPEQAEGLKVDARADIFSFGAVLFEMVTGQRAFDGDSGIQTLSAVLRDDVKPIRIFAPDVPPELDELIVRCLRKNPADRWQSMAEVAVALNRMRMLWDAGPPSAPAPSAIGGNVPASTASLAPAGPTTPKVQTKKTGIKSVLLLAVGCVALVALAIGVAWWQAHRLAAPSSAANPATPAASAPPPPQTTPSAADSPAAIPPPAPETQNSATDVVSSTAAPPPSTAVAALGNKARTPAPPPVVTTVQPKPSIAAAPPAVTPPTPRPPALSDLVSVTLNDGVPFRIALMEDVINTIEVGQPVRFRVLDGLQSGDVVVIAKGAVVTGSIVSLGGKRNFFGERAKAKFRLISAATVDGSKIDVRATPMPKNDGDETRPFENPKGSKDKSLIAAAGAEFVAYVAGDQTVRIHK